jgi:hypothetical protein
VPPGIRPKSSIALVYISTGLAVAIITVAFAVGVVLTILLALARNLVTGAAFALVFIKSSLLNNFTIEIELHSVCLSISMTLGIE